MRSAVFLVIIVVCTVCLYVSHGYNRDYFGTSPKQDLAVSLLTLAVGSLMSLLWFFWISPTTQAPKDKAAALDVFDMQVPYRGRCRLLPLALSVLSIVVPFMLWLFGCVYSSLFMLTIYGLYNAWKMGLQIAIFAVLGCGRIAAHQRKDFKALYLAGQHEASVTQNAPKWDDIVHFVILPNYKEDPEVLRLAIESIAQASIAARQICLVLAMEAREFGAEGKAELLRESFLGRFMGFFITSHPPDLLGEMPGKSSNTRWAANQVFNTYMPLYNVDRDHAILTVADADSEFHPEYFAALSFHFLSSGIGVHAAPQRYLTIWQPPILHFKNYMSQPAIVRWCSVITSLHELSCLADPNATRIPYSTYSISATLASVVNGWDPDWISEDWHMALKCFLSTGGRLQVSPLFLPVLNYAPEGESSTECHQARWAQGKRHALGFAELVYFVDHFWRILFSIRGSRDKIMFLWRSIFLWTNCLMTHLVMATYWFLAPLNAFIITWLIWNRRPHFSWGIEFCIVAANSLTQLVICISFIGVCAASARVFTCVRDRIQGSDGRSLSLRWRFACVNTICTTLETGVCLPIFFILAAACEWIAAIKTARTHCFDYEVALKPNLSKDKDKDIWSESTSSCAHSLTQSELPSEEEDGEALDASFQMNGTSKVGSQNLETIVN